MQLRAARFVILLVVLWATPANFASSQELTKSLEHSLLGSWSLEYHDSDGILLDHKGGVIEFKANNKATHKEPGLPEVEGDYFARPLNKDDFELDLTWKDESGLSWLCLARFDKGKLVLYFNADNLGRPASPHPKLSKGKSVLILHRGR